MISGLVKAGTKAGTTGRMRLGAIPSQRTIPRLCQRGMETQKLLDDCESDVLKYKRASNPGDHCNLIPRLISGLTGRARKHLRMAGDLDRFAVDGGLEQFLEYLKTKWVFVDHRKREWHSRSTSRWAASPQGENERSGHCWSHDHDRRQLEHQTCRKISSRIVHR